MAGLLKVNIRCIVKRDRMHISRTHKKTEKSDQSLICLEDE